VRIGIVAPSCQLDAAVPARVAALAEVRGAELIFSDQCFLSAGHFAGEDGDRAEAFVAMANDPAIDAIWCARGGYGANRIAPDILDRLNASARDKAYLGYSDAGFLLAGLYRHGIGRVAHGPMVSDIKRTGGEAAVERALDWLVDPAAASVFAPKAAGKHKVAAFNLTVFSHLLGTTLEPNLADHVLMLEDVDEYMYRVDRALFHVTSSPNIRKVAGLMVGRLDPVPGNDPDFGMDGEAVMQHWCGVSGIPYLGRADIGHDADNKVVPFG
jgi:muramoyltetrapeptide carboxypeptidase